MAELEYINKILVTGANGFVGRSLCSELLHRNISIRTSSRSQLPSDIDHIYIPTISNNPDWSVALANIGTVIHLAARVHVMRDTVTNSLAEFREVNVHGTVNVAKQAAQAGVKRFVYVSSIKVNGESSNLGQPFDETDSPHPNDPYAISKWEAEHALQSIARDTGMELVIIRPPLVYGPSVKANFAKLIKLVDRGVPLPLGNICNSRSLIYVGNLVDALITCATHSAAAGQVYLVSDDDDVSTPGLVDALAKALHRPNRVIPMPISLIRSAAKFLGKSSAIDRLTQSLVIDSSKIRNELDWHPPYSMAQGLQATADWYRQTYQPAKAQ